MAGNGHPKKRKNFAGEVGAKETRKMEARKHKQENLWFGLGMFGLVGWSVAIPTLIGVAIGAWIDLNYPTRFSWTLMLMVFGVLLGCVNAWYWVNRFNRHG